VEAVFKKKRVCGERFVKKVGFKLGAKSEEVMYVESGESAECDVTDVGRGESKTERPG